MTQHYTGRTKTATSTGVTLALAAASVATAGGAHAAEQEHTVRPGETVSHLAARTGVSVAAIARANDLTDPSRVVAGQRLVIPSKDIAATKRAKASATARTTAHTVASGDTVSHLAVRYGTSVRQILEANGLDALGFIVVGQKLAIPGADAPNATKKKKSKKSSSSASYTVAPGDTVSSIAAKFEVSVSMIVQANRLDSRAFIRAGQRLAIPGASDASSSYELSDDERVGDTFAGRTYPKHVVASANKNKALLLEAGVPSRATMQSKVASKAREMGVSAALAQAIAFQESGFNHGVVSPANAIGTMQVIPASGDWAADLVGHSINLLDPDDNVTAGVAILRQLIRMSPDLDSAIAGYYQGAASVRKYGMFSDTRRYVANVRTLMERFA